MDVILLKLQTSNQSWQRIGFPGIRYNRYDIDMIYDVTCPKTKIISDMTQYQQIVFVLIIIYSSRIPLITGISNSLSSSSSSLIILAVLSVGKEIRVHTQLDLRIMFVMQLFLSYDDGRPIYGHLIYGHRMVEEMAIGWPKRYDHLYDHFSLVSAKNI